MPLAFSQALFHQEVRTLLERLVHLPAEALVGKLPSAADQLLIQPGCTDGTDLSLYRKRCA
ncbi:hypothetical protein D3C80_2039200 [compost metagenome]